MNGIYLYFVNKHLSTWVLLGLYKQHTINMLFILIAKELKINYVFYFSAYPPLPSTTIPTTRAAVTRPRTQGVTTGAPDTTKGTTTNKAPTVTKEKLPFGKYYLTFVYNDQLDLKRAIIQNPLCLCE